MLIFNCFDRRGLQDKRRRETRSGCYIDEELKEEDQPNYWTKTLEVAVEVGGKKKCKVCALDVEVKVYDSHVKQHSKECLVPLIPISSQKFLRENQGLIIKSSLPLIQEEEKDPSLKGMEQEELMDPQDLIDLLNKDYRRSGHFFYSQPGVKIHDNLAYQVSGGKKPFL